MNKLSLNPEDILPGIILDHEIGKFKFFGKSCPNNAHEFYEPVLEWIDNYTKEPQETTVLEFYLSYFNTLSAKIILQIMNKMEKLAESGRHVTILWMYNENDEILKEAGIDFETIVNVRFEFIAIKNIEDESDDESLYNLIDDII